MEGVVDRGEQELVSRTKFLGPATPWFWIIFFLTQAPKPLSRLCFIVGPPPSTAVAALLTLSREG